MEIPDDTLKQAVESREESASAAPADWPFQRPRPAMGHTTFTATPVHWEFDPESLALPIEPTVQIAVSQANAPKPSTFVRSEISSKLVSRNTTLC